MYRSIAEIRQFYQSALGRLTARAIRHALAREWPEFLNDSTLSVGVGYALPYLDETLPHYALMSASQGVIRWPHKGSNRTALSEDHVLPFEDKALPQLLLVHAVENADYLRELMSEAWRVLASNGRIIMIVPNRRGIWARVDKTPFGHGRPFSMKQMRTLLRDTDFVIENHTRALYMLPSHNRLLLALSSVCERVGRKLLPKFGGVLIIEASKRLYNVTPIPVGKPVTQTQKSWASEPIATG